jgi:hypothetical protein
MRFWQMTSLAIIGAALLYSARPAQAQVESTAPRAPAVAASTWTVAPAWEASSAWGRGGWYRPGWYRPRWYRSGWYGSGIGWYGSAREPRRSRVGFDRRW